MQENPVASRFLFMTGGVFSSEAQRFLEELGADRWMAKPNAIANLRRAVTQMGAR